tara:strand:+ start:241 stop:471 length:231 start_codon:yes stop_codon:yes gene_type:complete
MKWLKNITNAPFLLFIFLYQKLISPFLGPTCRFRPTCSAYSVESIKKYGIFKGLWLSVNRIIKCHPWGSSGYDPVP